MLPEKIRNNKLFTEETSSLAETFKEKLHYEYRSKLLAGLKDALKSVPPVDALKNILTNDWGLVKGSTLCYTTHPQSDLTLLLCDIADYISEATKEAPIKILMPAILTESFSENFNAYPNLDTVDMRSVLKTHILNDSKSYLIPIRILTELKGPWEDLDGKLNNYYYDYSKPALNSPYINESEFTRLSNCKPSFFSAKLN